jgi:hypothetical protein
MKIQVTQDDINNGERSSKYCPIALAIKRACNTENVFVGIASIRWDEREIIPHYEIVKFIRDFDDGIKVNPCEFIVTPGYCVYVT